MRFFVFLSVFLNISISALGAEVLSPSEYWKQVSKSHEGVLGSEATSTGARERSKEATLQLSPVGFFQGQSFDDRSPKSNAALMGTHTESVGYSLGVQDQTSFGLQTKLYYNLSHSKTEGASPNFLPLPEYNDGRMVLEFNQSFLRNGFGRETRSNIEASEAIALANVSSELFKVNVTQMEAELTYWRLATARSIVNIQRQSVDRAQKISDWNAKRLANRLVDKSDYLQSQALLKIRLVDLKLAEDELRSAEFAFNSLRGRNSTEVPEAVEDIANLDISTIKLPARSEKRNDVEAAYQQARALKAAAQSTAEKNSAQLDVYGTVAWNGRDFQQSEAISESFKSDQATNTFGFRYSMPLDIGLLKNNKSGAQKEALGADLKYRRKLFEQERDWSELNRKFNEIQKKYEIVREMQTVQREKYLNEKERHSAGRTTTFLVLQFEQDYAAAQLLLLKTKAELVSLLAQMKIFGGV